MLCGMFAIGRCTNCEQGVCSVHSTHPDGSLSCFGCAPAVRARSEELGRRNVERWQREHDALPVVSRDDLPRFLRGELPGDPLERGTRLGEYTGAELAQAAQEAGLKASQQLLRKKAFLRPARFEMGWPISTRVSGDGDIRSSSVSTFLVVSGTLYESQSHTERGFYSSSLEVKCLPHEVLPAAAASELQIGWQVYGKYW